MKSIQDVNVFTIDCIEAHQKVKPAEINWPHGGCWRSRSHILLGRLLRINIF